MVSEQRPTVEQFAEMFEELWEAVVVVSRKRKMNICSGLKNIIIYRGYKIFNFQFSIFNQLSMFQFSI